MSVCIALHCSGGQLATTKWITISQIFSLLFHFIPLFSLLVIFSVSGPRWGPLVAFLVFAGGVVRAVLQAGEQVPQGR